MGDRRRRCSIHEIHYGDRPIIEDREPLREHRRQTSEPRRFILGTRIYHPFRRRGQNVTSIVETTVRRRHRQRVEESPDNYTRPRLTHSTEHYRITSFDMPPPTTSGNYVPLPPTLPREEEKKRDKKKKASKKLKKLDDSDSSDDDSSRSPKSSPYYNVVARDPKDYKKHKHRTGEVLPDNVRYEAIRPGGKESPRLKRRDSKSGRYHDVDWTPRYTGEHAISRDLSATKKTSKKLEEALQTTSYKAKEAEDAALHNYTAAYNEALKAKATEKELDNLRKQYASLSLDLKDAAELNTKLSNRLKDSELREREKALEERQWVEISGNPKPRTIDRAPLGPKPLINRPIRPVVPKTETGMDAMDAIQRDYQSRRANENNEYITGGALADRRRERRRS